MTSSVFDLFSIGVGPSSSHTVGPMLAAREFALELAGPGPGETVDRLTCDLFGSLAATGAGHGTPDAVIAGLEGSDPGVVDPEWMRRRVAEVRDGSELRLPGGRTLRFRPDDILSHPLTRLEFHSNGMRFRAWADGAAVLDATYYSVGGGFIEREGRPPAARPVVPFEFGSAEELLSWCERTGLSVSDLMLQNELALRSEDEVRQGILTIWEAMRECIEEGFRSPGTLPGGLQVVRRAPAWFERLTALEHPYGPEHAMDWLNAAAMSVNEQNAAGARVVTAPTNGAAGVVPSVLYYAAHYLPGFGVAQIQQYLLTAAAIGSIFKQRASISGAEVGCQGEVGSACAMAAAGLAELFGGSPWQVENAAEIAMEHNLGLTCDPVGGLVQIPCIERNAIGAVKSLNAAKMAVVGDGTHRVSLDQVIETMRQTGERMHSDFKETSLGGLAVNVPEC